MSDDFLEFDDDSGGSTSEGGGSRSFLIIVGLLGTILVIGIICVAVIFINRSGGNTNNAAQIAEVETRNAIISITNEAVTQTIEAMETEQASTPTGTPTNTPEPTATQTPEPTDTPVVQAAEVETGEEETGEEGSTDRETDSPEAEEGSEVAENSETTDSEATTAEGEAGTEEDSGNITTGSGETLAETDTVAVGSGSAKDTEAVTGNSTNTTTGNTTETLPQTGLETWIAVLGGLVLMGVLLITRRLRN